MRKIGKGAFGSVFQVRRNSDGIEFALKFTNPKSDIERQEIINECSLIQHLNCDQLIRCEEVYDYKGRIWVFLELMEGGSMTDLVLRRNGDFSESFVRWTLYQVALGLKAMHDENVLHRDIKSDNILIRPNG